MCRPLPLPPPPSAVRGGPTNRRRCNHHHHHQILTLARLRSFSTCSKVPSPLRSRMMLPRRDPMVRTSARSRASGSAEAPDAAPDAAPTSALAKRSARNRPGEGSSKDEVPRARRGRRMRPAPDPARIRSRATAEAPLASIMVGLLFLGGGELLKGRPRECGTRGDGGWATAGKGSPILCAAARWNKNNPLDKSNSFSSVCVRASARYPPL